MLTGSIVALVTPMNQDGGIDREAWRRLLDRHDRAGTHGVVVAGTTGESPTIGEDEYADLLAIAVERLGGRLAVIAGTGNASTAQTIARTHLAAGLGADSALVVTPPYNRPPQRGLEAHFRAVADASDIPIILYNVPGRTSVDLLPETSLKLAGHPGIIGIKEAVGDAERVRLLVTGGMNVLSGDDPTCCQRMLDEGANGVISVAANVVPEAMVRLCDHARAGRPDQALAEHQRLEALFEFLSAEANPLPVKWLLHQTGWIGPALRLPLVELDEQFHARGRELMEQLSLEVV